MTFYMRCLFIHKTNVIKIDINLLAFWALKHFIIRNLILGFQVFDIYCVLMTSLFAYHKYTINIKF